MLLLLLLLLFTMELCPVWMGHTYQFTFPSSLTTLSLLVDSSANALKTLTKRVSERNLMPMDYVIVEVVFGVLLQLPSPPQVLVYYSALLIELCKMEPTSYPRIVSSVVVVVVVVAAVAVFLN